MICITLINELAIGVIGGLIGYKIGVNKEKVARKTADTLHKMFKTGKEQS